MNDTKRSIRLLILAAACCFALVLIPVSSYAQLHTIVAQLGGVAHGVQHGVQKGAEGVQKGAEGTYNKGKEVITGEDQNQQQTEQQKATPSEENRMKPGTETEQQNQTEQNENYQNQTEQKTKSQTGETGKQMPRTAGELPLLVMTGLLSLAGARATRRLK
jgi:flagellar biosynthesis component FlhA